MNVTRLKCMVAYEGTEFQGWQVQPGARTVQLVLEEAFATLKSGEGGRIHGSGRTDAGVHARGQVFHVDVERDYTSEKWREALNAVLPRDVQVLDVEKVPAAFHARFDAKEKEYRYFLWTGPVCPPDLRRVRHHVRTPLDVATMQEACARLQGEHDFRSFSAVRVDADEDTVRHVRLLTLDASGHELILTAKAPGFLYKMVRQLMGALLRIGKREMSLGELQDLLDAPRIGHEAPSAPAQGLFLWQVRYEGGE